MRVHQQVNYEGNRKSIWFSEHFGFPGGADGSLPAVWETGVRSLGQEDPLEKDMATYYSILPWSIPWTEEPGGLQSMGLQRVGHD